MRDLYISRHQLTDDNSINYEVKVTNTGNMGGALALLAFVTSDVSINQLVYSSYNHSW